MASKLDPIQIQRMTVDEETSSVRVKMVPMEMAIELDANDGDSVLSVPKMEVLEVEAGQVVDCSQAKRVACLPDAVLTAVVLEQEASIGSVSISGKDICVPAVKADKACIIILQS